MTRVLVTGGAGFVGSHLVDRLIKDGYEVTVVDNLDDQVHDDKPGYRNDAAEYVWGDIRDEDLMKDLLEKADVLSHQASAVGVGQSMYEIDHYVDVNTQATARLLDIIVNEDIDLEKMVVASSMSIYGEGAYNCPDCDTTESPPLRDADQLARGEWEHYCSSCGTELEPTPTGETTPLACPNIYAITKRDQEEMMLAIGDAYDIPAVALRYFNIYGSRQSLDNPYTGVCAIFSSRIMNESPPLIFEDGKQTRDFVHVSDIARANQLAIEEEAANGQAINIGTGNPRTVHEIAETLIDLYGKSETLSPEIADDHRAGDIRHCYADITRAKELLGFEPQVDFEEGMRRLVAWGRDQDATDQFEKAHDELAEKGLVDD